jgi:hypothetical protein
MKEYLSWVLVQVQLAHIDPDKARKRRQQMVQNVWDGLKSYRPKTPQNKEARYLSDILQDSNTWEIVGFAVNSQYIRLDHDNDEMLKYIFVHPWGTPPLVLAHKRLPIFVTVGPGLRWNDSILREISANGYKDRVEGQTG